MSKLSLAWLTALGAIVTPGFAQLAAFTDGMYCPELKYKGPLTNMTDPNLAVFDPLYNLTQDSWFLSKGRNCLLAEPTGVWEIPANSNISVPWASWQNSTGYYADGKNLTDRPIPYSVTNPRVVAEGLVSESAGLASPDMRAANKSTAAGTAIAIAYVDNVYAVTMENLIVVSTAPETPFERLANYTIPDLAPCESCICVTGWVPSGYGQQNMYMAAHKCKISNTGAGKKPVTPGQVPGPGVAGAKQMIAAFQAEGNSVFWEQGVNSTVPAYSSRMGYMDGAQLDIFGNDHDSSSSAFPAPALGSSSVAATSPAHAATRTTSNIAETGKVALVVQGGSKIKARAVPTTTQATIWGSILTLTTRTLDPVMSTNIPGNGYTVMEEILPEIQDAVVEFPYSG